MLEDEEESGRSGVVVGAQVDEETKRKLEEVAHERSEPSELETVRISDVLREAIDVFLEKEGKK